LHVSGISTGKRGKAQESGRHRQAGTGRQANPKLAFAIFTNARLAQFWQNCVSESPKLFTVMASMTFYF
jgi:hypothetical protein